VRAPGRPFGPARALTPWIAQDAGAGTGQVAAGADAAGRLTVAWARPVRGEGTFPGTSEVAVSTAAPRGELGSAQVLVPRASEVERLSLAVAPDGGALLAADGDGQVRVFERGPGADAFAAGPALGTEGEAAERPAVALLDGGGAVVAWRTEGEERGNGIRAIRRERSGAFGAPAEVAAPDGPGESGSAFVILFGAGIPASSFGEDQSGPRVALARDGRLVIAWIGRRPAPDGDRVPAGRAAAGSLAEGLAAPRWLGSRCRAANAVAALLLEGAEPGAAFSDNETVAFGGGELEFPYRRGRVALAFPGRPDVAAPPAPRITLRARAQRLFFDEPLEVSASCDRPCDLRGRLPGRGALGTAALGRAGTVTLRLRPDFRRTIARRDGRRARVAVHACSSGADALASARLDVRVRRRKPPRVPRVTNLRAVRLGREVRVSWRTPFPARRVDFAATARRERSRRRANASPVASESVPGRGRTRFAVRLRSRSARFVELTASPRDPGNSRSRTRIVRIR